MTQVKIDIPLPKGLTSSDRRAIADDVIEFIRARTEDGRDKNNRQFPGYSKAYIESLAFRAANKSKGKVNLTLTGDMLISLRMLKERSDGVTIGFDEGEIENDKALGNIKGTYGNDQPIPGKKRDFMGITVSDLTKLIRPYTDMTLYAISDFLRNRYDPKQSEALPLS